MELIYKGSIAKSPKYGSLVRGKSYKVDDGDAERLIASGYWENEWIKINKKAEKTEIKKGGLI